MVASVYLEEDYLLEGLKAFSIESCEIKKGEDVGPKTT
jgi:hypothetical protein